MYLKAKVIDVDYDLIIGYSDIKKHPEILQDLLNKSSITGQNNNAPIEIGMRKHLLATLTKSLHVSDLLSGGGDEGDDLSEEFEYEAPWEQDVKQTSNERDNQIHC